MPFLAKSHFPVSNQDILSWIFDDYKHDWDRPTYVDGLDTSRLYTVKQCKTLIRQLAAGLRAIGVQPGDCVSIHSFNDICYPLFFLGLIAAGGIFAGTNPAYTEHELAHTLRTAEVKFVLVAPQYLNTVLAATKHTSIPARNVIIFNPKGEAAPPNHLQWSDLLRHGERDWVRFNDAHTAQHTGAARLYSSGTTGLPKAAELSHANLVAQQMLVYEAEPRPWRAVRIFNLPLFHAATAPSAFCAPLREGSTAYVYPRFDLEQWVSGIERFGVTELVCVPPLVLALVNSPLSKKYSLKSIRIGTVGAAPLDKELQKRVQALLEKNAPMTQVWGMTELSCVGLKHSWWEHDDTGSIGKPLPNLDVKLVDDEGKDITDYDVRGEICVRGPNVIRGYFRNPEANARDWDADGYFHTGDICYVDGKSKLYYIVDRKKELIKVRGFQVAPPEIEGVLLSHADIADCGVIGVPDPVRESDELPRAYIVRKGGGSKPTETDIHAWIKKHLASYKRLEGGVVFVDEIPKNASGKILKRVLRDRAKEEMKSSKQPSSKL